MICDRAESIVPTTSHSLSDAPSSRGNDHACSLYVVARRPGWPFDGGEHDIGERRDDECASWNPAADTEPTFVALLPGFDRA